MSNVNELRAKRYKLVQDAQALLTAGEMSAETNTRFDAMMDDADILLASIERQDRADQSLKTGMEAIYQRAKATGQSSDEILEGKALEAATFDTWMRRGAGALNESQRAIYDRRFQAAQSEGTNSAGGYTVPVDNQFMTQIEDAQKAYGGMTETAYVFNTTTAQPMPIPTDNDTGNVGAILSENTQTGNQDMTFGSVTFNGYTYTSKLVLVSNQLLQDAAFGLDAFLAKKLGTRIARITNTHFTTGTGSSQPNGAVTAGTLGYTAGGSTSSGSVTAISYADLIELEHSVDPAYRLNGRFMLSDTALKNIKKLVDTLGRPLWSAGFATKEPDTINGYPYTINQDLAVPAASAKTVLFGDFSKYFIRKVEGIQMLRLVERYADYNQTGFLMFQRWDGNLVDAGTHPIKYLQQSAT